jgi:endoglucanase
VWVGEFGTDNTAADVSSSTPGSQGQWFASLISYVKAAPWMGWTYWALNGEDSYDLLDGSYNPTPVSAAKQSLLASIQFPLPGAGNGSPPPTGPSSINGWTLTWTFPGDQKIGSFTSNNTAPKAFAVNGTAC